LLEGIPSKELVCVPAHWKEPLQTSLLGGVRCYTDQLVRRNISILVYSVFLCFLILLILILLNFYIFSIQTLLFSRSSISNPRSRTQFLPSSHKV
jgi:hypothetical protein